MHSVLRDMFQWTIGFCIVSFLYLLVVVFIARRLRKRAREKSERRDDGQTESR